MELFFSPEVKFFSLVKRVVVGEKEEEEEESVEVEVEAEIEVVIWELLTSGVLSLIFFSLSLSLLLSLLLSSLLLLLYQIFKLNISDIS